MPRKQPVLRKQPTTTAMELVDANASRTGLLIQNAGTVAVGLGDDATVTYATGLQLAAGASLDTDDTGAWWAVAQSGTADLRLVESW